MLRKEKKRKWYIGKSPKDRKWKALRIVYDELLPSKQPIRFADLKIKAKEMVFGISTLTKKLRELNRRGWVKRIVDSKAFPPSVSYIKEPLPTIVFFERLEDNSVSVVDSSKSSSMIEFTRAQSPP